MPTIINGDQVNIRVPNTNAEVSAAGSVVQIEITGAAGAGALVRRLAIFRIRANADFTAIETEVVSNNTYGTFEFSFTENVTTLIITSTFFSESRYSIQCSVNTRSIGQTINNSTVSINALALIYIDPALSEWAYIIVEDLEQLITSNIGQQGYSAYEVAVQDGFEGDEPEWLATLVGPPGETGLTGYTSTFTSGTSFTITSETHLIEDVMSVSIYHPDGNEVSVPFSIVDNDVIISSAINLLNHIIKIY